MIRPCDIVICYGYNFVGNLIRAFCSENDGHLTPSHVALGTIGQYQILEAHWKFWGKAVTQQDVRKYFTPKYRVEVYRPKMFTDAQMDAMDSYARHLMYESGRYSMWKIFMQAADSIFGTHWFTRHLTNDHNPICSFYAGEVYNLYRYELGGCYKSISPDDMSDYARESDDFYCPWVWDGKELIFNPKEEF